MAAVLAPLLAPVLTGGAATIAANLAIYAATTAASYFLQQALAPEQKDPGIRGDVAFGEDVPQSFVVGYYATAGSLVYANAYGGTGRTPNAYLVQVFCLSDLPVEGIASHLWVNSKRCNIDTGTSTSRGNPIPAFDRGGNSHMWIKFLDGTQTTADSYLMDKFGAHATHPWSSDMVGRGRALAIVTTRYDREQFSAFPQFLFPVYGVKLYDPRLDSTNGGSGAHRYGTASTYAYSDNAKVIAYNVARGVYYGAEWVYGGQDWPAWRLDNASWFAAMNECDEAVSLAAGGTEAQFAIGAEIRVNEKPADVLDRIDACSLGRSAEMGGIYKTYCGAPGASVISLTDDDIVATEPKSAGLFPGHEAWVNTVRANYIRPGNMWQPKAIAARTDAALVAADGGQSLEKAVQFDYLTSASRVQRIAEAMLRDGRRFVSHIVAAPPWARKVEQFDVVSWTSARFGYTAKKFMVGEVNRSRNGVVIWTLREVDPADHGWATGDETAELDGVFDDIEADTDIITITATAVSLRNNAGQNKRPAIKVNWTIDEDVVDVVGVAFQVRDASTLEVVRRQRSDDWQDGEHIISGTGILKNQNYEVRARWLTKSDRAIDWSLWTAVTAPDTGEDDDYTPDVPTGLSCEQITFIDEDGKADHKVIATWTANADPKVDYGVQITQGGKTWYSRSDDAKHRFDVRTGVTYSVRVRAISGKGSKSAYCTAVTITPEKDDTGPSAPTSLSLTAKPKSVRVVWDECSSADYKKTRIYRGTTATVGSASIVGRVAGTHWTDNEDLTIGTTYYYWVENVDQSGNVSAKYGGASVVYTGLKDADADQTAPTVPTGLAVVQLARDVDGDGRVDIAIKVTWSAVGASGANPKAVSYGVKVTQGSDVAYYQNDDTSIVLPAKAGKLYSIQVRAISFSGAKSAYAGAVTITPAADTTAPATPTGLAVVAKPRGQRLTWTDATEADYKRTLVYRNTTNNSATATLIARIAGTHYLDTEDLTRGTTYYYWIKHRDQSGNDSGFSSVVSISHRGAVAGDLDDEAVTTAKVLTGNVTTRDQASNYGTKTVGTTYENVAQVTANHGSGAEGVTLIGQFRANTAGPIQVRITKGGGTIVLEAVSMTVDANEWVCIHDNDPSPSGSSTSYDLEARISSGTLTVEFRKFTAINFKR